MAVTYDSSSAGLSDNGSPTVFFSYTCGSGADRYLLVATSPSSGPTNTAVSYNGTAMSLLATSGAHKLWGLVNPSSGANSISFTISSYGSVKTAATSFAGVDQTTPIGSVLTASGTGTTQTASSVTIGANDIAFASMRSGYASSAPTISAGTLAGSYRDGSDGHAIANGYRSTTGSVVWSTPGGGSWTAISLPILAVAGSAPTITGPSGKQMTGGFFDLSGGTS